MVRNHLKTLVAPKTWRILRKARTFITRPKPGAHALERCVALSTLLRELTKLAKTEKEAKYILTKQEVLVNHSRKRDHRYPVGFLDVVTIPAIKKNYLVIINKKGNIEAKEVPESETKHTLLRIQGKTRMKGKVQLNTMGGKNIMVTDKEAKAYKVGDTVFVTLPKYEVKEHYTLAAGAKALVFMGKNAGATGELLGIKQDVARMKVDGKEIETKKEYILITGHDKHKVMIE